jgi:hypothetical protein
MANHFNRLTPDEQERLVVLSEECAEVIQVVSKILRHGYESFHPSKPKGLGNRGQLQKELGHVLNAIRMMDRKADITSSVLYFHRDQKTRSIGKYLHHNEVKKNG